MLVDLKNMYSFNVLSQFNLSRFMLKRYETVIVVIILHIITLQFNVLNNKFYFLVIFLYFKSNIFTPDRNLYS